MKKKLYLLLIFSILTLSIIKQTESLSGWAFLNNQSDCQLNCQNGGVCAYNTDDVTQHKCICFIGMHHGKQCEIPIEPIADEKKLTQNEIDVAEIEKQVDMKEHFNSATRNKSPLYDDVKEPTEDSLYESELLLNNNDKNTNFATSSDLNLYESGSEENKNKKLTTFPVQDKYLNVHDKEEIDFDNKIVKDQKLIKPINKKIDDFYHTTKNFKTKQYDFTISASPETKRIIDNSHHNILKINNDESPIFKTSNLKQYENGGITQQIKSNGYSAEITLPSADASSDEDNTLSARPYRYQTSTTSKSAILDDIDNELNDVSYHDWMLTYSRRNSSINKIFYNFYSELLIILLIILNFH